MKTTTVEIEACVGHAHVSMTYCDLADRSEDVKLYVAMDPRELASYGAALLLTAVRTAGSLARLRLARRLLR